MTGNTPAGGDAKGTGSFAARRRFLGGMAFGAATLATGRTAVAGGDGHAAGYDVAPAESFMKTVPRKPGDPVAFSMSLDRNQGNVWRLGT